MRAERKYDILPIAAAIVCCGLVALACADAFKGSRNIDFASFWNASKFILQGSAEAAYGVGPNASTELLPTAYPPPFLFVVAPVGLLQFGPAFLAWTIVTGAAYALAARSRMTFANPAAAYNGLVGQNGFLTAGIMLAGLRLIATRPVLGGALLGTMIIKPQFALVLPVVVIAARLWPAIPAAMLSALSLLVAAALIFGTGAYYGFAATIGLYGNWLQSGHWPWPMLASFYAIGRWFGLGGFAWALHWSVAFAALTAVWFAWRQGWNSRIPVAASASLLISPYLFAYDAVLLVSPLAWLYGRHPHWAAGVWLLAALQLARSFGAYDGPATTPIAAALAIAVMWRSERSAKSEGRPLTNGNLPVYQT